MGDTPQVRTLRRASEALGGEAKLAVELAVAPEQLQLWIAGKATLPTNVYLAALEIVARGPLPRR